MAFSLQHRCGVTYVVSDALLSRHAFSTRMGGVSTLPHTASLNLAYGRGDEDAVVRENLARLAKAVGFNSQSVISGPQLHGRLVHLVNASHRGMGYDRPAEAMAGDGYVTSDPTVVAGVKTADCTPILLEARCNGIPIAVAALHAGWKGTTFDIVGVGVSRLCAAASAVRASDAGASAAGASAAGASGAMASEVTIHAAIGPCIHACCFEVQEDCLTVVRERLGAMAEDFMIRTSARTGVRTTLDLPGLNRALLLRAGVPAAHIDICPDCTACHTELYYSHRAQKGMRGTMLSMITLGGTGKNE